MTKSRKKTEHALGLIMTPRLKACLEAGSAENLRPILAGWDERQLKLLHRDLHVAYDAAVCELDYQYQHAVRSGGFLPEIETIYRVQRAGLHETFAEIHQELGFYLDKQPKGKIQ
jgi:hypothetical protein